MGRGSKKAKAVGALVVLACALGGIYLAFFHTAPATRTVRYECLACYASRVDTYTIGREGEESLVSEGTPEPADLIACYDSFLGKKHTHDWRMKCDWIRDASGKLIEHSTFNYAKDQDRDHETTSGEALLRCADYELQDAPLELRRDVFMAILDLSANGRMVESDIADLIRGGRRMGGEGKQDDARRVWSDWLKRVEKLK